MAWLYDVTRAEPVFGPRILGLLTFARKTYSLVTTLTLQAECDHTTPPEPEKVSRPLAGAIFATAILSFLGLLLETVLNVLFPALMVDFAISMADVQWMTSGYLLVVAILIPLSGFLNRRFTSRSLFVTAACAVIFGAIVAALAPSYGILLFGRLIQGVGTGLATPLMFNIILTQAPASKKGQLMGVGALVLGIAPALGPVVGGAIETAFGWRAVFWLVLPLALISLVVGWRSIRQATPLEKVKLDYLSLIALAAGFVGLILGIERLGAYLAARAQADGAASTGSMVTSLVLIAAGVVFLAAFFVRSQRTAAPLIRLGALRSPVFLLSLTAFALLQFVALGLGYLIPNYAQLSLGTNALQAGLTVLPGALIGAALAPVGGAMLDRFGAQLPIVLGTSVAFVGSALLALAGSSLAIGGVVAFYLVFMLGFGITYANTQTHAMQAVARKFTVDGTAVMNTAQQFSGAVAMTILATIVTIAQGKEQLGAPAFAAATANGVGYALLVVALVALIATVANIASFQVGRKVKL